VYHYGGFYFDMDIEPLEPLDNAILNHQAVFPIDEYADDHSCKTLRMKEVCKKGFPFLLGQYAFGATAKHPFLKWVVDKIRKNTDKYIEVFKQIQISSSNREDVHYYVFKTTGPDFITDCYHNYKKPEQFYILSNMGKRQVFGKYGKHIYFGSWK
jgi:mannosyltransferase OCH1-like enzyme